MDVRFYPQGANLLETLREELRDADVVIIHEWNHPEVANTILSLKPELGFLCLLHDTACRAVTDANQMLRFQLQFFDGVLAFAEPIRRIYRDGFGLTPAWTFREAADVSHFHPRDVPREIDVLWLASCIGTNCSCEHLEDLIQSVAELRDCLPVVHGEYYSERECRFLSETGIEYSGYMPI